VVKKDIPVYSNQQERVDAFKTLLDLVVSLFYSFSELKRVLIHRGIGIWLKEHLQNLRMTLDGWQFLKLEKRKEFLDNFWKKKENLKE
jgi:hypothetical protein